MVYPTVIIVIPFHLHSFFKPLLALGSSTHHMMMIYDDNMNMMIIEFVMNMNIMIIKFDDEFNKKHIMMMMMMNLMMNLIINNLLIKHLMENMNLNYAYDKSTIKCDLLHQHFSDSMINDNNSNVNDDQIKILHRVTTIFTNLE